MPNNKQSFASCVIQHLFNFYDTSYLQNHKKNSTRLTTFKKWLCHAKQLAFLCKLRYLTPARGDGAQFLRHLITS